MQLLLLLWMRKMRLLKISCWVRMSVLLIKLKILKIKIGVIMFNLGNIINRRNQYNYFRGKTKLALINKAKED